MMTAGVPAQSDEVPVKWAILAEPQVGDLLFAELAAVTEIALVERERFAEILNEQNLAALSEPKTVGRRLELGKMLAADRLLTLRSINVQEKTWQRLAVFDTKSGATIFDATLFDKSDPAETAKTVTAIVRDLNREFKDGVKTAIAVPDFLSTGMLEELIPYQESFARLITALLQRKGVSVVSFEELESLQRESEIGNRRSGNRADRSAACPGTIQCR